MIIPKPPNFLTSRYGGDSAVVEVNGKNFWFDVYPIETRPNGVNDVYAFCKELASGYEPLYIGQAKNVPNRLLRHEKLDRAKELGATKVLIHSPIVFWR